MEWKNDMNIALKKTLAVIVALVVLGLLSWFVGYLEGQYQFLFPDLSARALRNIESVSNIVGLVLAVYISIKVYKRLAKIPPKESAEKIENE